MDFFNKLRPGQVPALPPKHSSPGTIHSTGRVAVASSATPPPTTGAQTKSGRQSNGLKEFLWQLDGIGRGHLLDLGPARQTTITFFIERGYKVYTEDLLTTWKNFLDAEEQRKQGLPLDADRSEMNPASRAERFLETTLRY